jgi:hypothetical protein
VVAASNVAPPRRGFEVFLERNNYKLAGSHWEYSADPANGPRQDDIVEEVERFRGGRVVRNGPVAIEVSWKVLGVGLAATTPISSEGLHDF